MSDTEIGLCFYHRCKYNSAQSVWLHPPERRPYAVCGTELAHGPERLCAGSMQYAATELAYGATSIPPPSPLPLTSPPPPYGAPICLRVPPMPYAVLSELYQAPMRYAVRGTEGANNPTRSALASTEVGCSA
eukprot:296869-Rhodomonas_salina.2